MTNVLVHITWPVKAWSIPDAYVDQLRSEFPDVSLTHTRDLDAKRTAITHADIAFTPALTPELVDAAPRLRWVHSPAAAVDDLLPLPALRARGIIVTNSRGVQSAPIAEHVMAGLLALSRKLDRTILAQRERRWIQNDLFDDRPWTLEGKRMTIVGLGSIGTEVARRAQAFGMTIVGVRRHPTREQSPFVEGVVGPNQLDEALAGCDVLVLAAPAIAATQRMIGRAQLERLNRGAVLVNVARAQIVDQDAMQSALESGQLGGAVLDVFEREPLPQSSALWELPNVIITPHSSGFRAEHWDRTAGLFAENLRRFRRGEPLLNVVDTTAGY
jgi:phosphoglycerate dehydrogenase-like enzyme